MYIFCILRLKAWQPKWYYFWRRLLIPIHSTLRVWYDISNFPSILLPLLYFIKGQEISKFNGPILILFKKRMKFFLNFDLSCLDQNLEIILYFFLEDMKIRQMAYEISRPLSVALRILRKMRMYFIVKSLHIEWVTPFWRRILTIPLSCQNSMIYISNNY